MKVCVGDEPSILQCDWAFVMLGGGVWEGEQALNAYRNSPLFGTVWPATKALFSEPPVARSHDLLWAR
ncbi:MAG: hypothetical protein CMC97_03175 [Flavobacteriales bacterium]|nr:hypothetical protein [Flavobacteriales bacterium]